MDNGVVIMTVSETATQIKTVIDAITETIGTEEVEVVSKSWIGDIGAPPNVGEIIVTIIAREEEEEDVNYPGNNPPPKPKWVPWEIYVVSVGQDVTSATIRLYDVVPMIKDALRADLSFNGTCDEGIFPSKSVVYGAGGTNKNDLKPSALINLKTYYSQ